MAKSFLPMSFDELYQEIDLVEFALHLGFKIDKSRTAKGIVLKKDEDNINVYYVKPSGEPWGLSAYYYNLNQAKHYDKGFLKHFVINYCNLEDPQNQTYSVSKILHDYLNIPYKVRQSEFKHRLENFSVNRNNNSVQLPVSLDDNRVKELDDYRFLTHFRKFDMTTLDFFKEQIYNFQAPVKNVNQVFYNTAFPLYFDGEVQGFEIRNQTYKSNIKHFEGNAYGAWISTTDFKNIQKVCYGESALDCMAHFELNKNENQNTLYISFSGNLYQQKLDNIIDILKRVCQESRYINYVPENKGLEKFENLNLVSITDNDRAGGKYELELLLGLIKEDLPDPFILKGLDKTSQQTDGLFYELIIPKNVVDKEIITNLNDHINQYNVFIEKTFVGDKKELYYHYLRVSETKNEYHRYIIPNNNSALRSFSKILANNFKKDFYKSQLSNKKDWNGQLIEVKKKPLIKNKSPFVSKGL